MKLLDRRIAEDKSAASLFAVENPELTKNMEAWRQASEKDERVLNMNPYVRRYIKQEILKSSALGFDAALKDAYATSGMVNERDPEKILKWGQEFRRQYTEQAGIKGEGKDMDQLDIAEHYTAYTTASLDALLGKHNRDVESQNANLLEQQMFQNISDTLAGKMNPLTGGYNVHIPTERESYVADAAQIIMGKAEEMKKLGYSQDRILGMLGKAVLMGNHSAAVAEGLAKNMTIDVNGKPVNLLSQPGIAKGIQELTDKEIERQRNKTRWGWAVKENARREAAYAAERAGASYGASNDDLSFETVVTKLHLCSPEAYDSFYRTAQLTSQARFYSPENIINIGRLKYNIGVGTQGWADIEDAVHSKALPPKEAVDLMNFLIAKKNGEMEHYSSAIQDIGKTLLSGITGASVEEGGAMYMAYSTGRKAPVGVVAEAMSRLPGITLEFENFVNEQRAKKGKEDAAFTQSEMLLYKQQFVAEKLPATIASLKERYAAEKGSTADSTQFSKLVNEIAAGERSGAWVTNKLDVEGNMPFTASVNALNTLFKDQIPPEYWEGINTISDALTFAQNNTPGGLSWQDTFFIAVGARPESLGVTSVQQAVAFIPNHFKQLGFKVKEQPLRLVPQKETGGEAH